MVATAWVSRSHGVGWKDKWRFLKGAAKGTHHQAGDGVWDEMPCPLLGEMQKTLLDLQKIMLDLHKTLLDIHAAVIAALRK
ncbi:hypothetical protein [Pyrobaculum sp.]|uniref:hypothetical protein n=1 Tax=Pyrobaculum sp. TaxID=2004705 RepID=UPI00319E5B3E